MSPTTISTLRLITDGAVPQRSRGFFVVILRYSISTLAAGRSGRRGIGAIVHAPLWAKLLARVSTSSGPPMSSSTGTVLLIFIAAHTWHNPCTRLAKVEEAERTTWFSLLHFQLYSALVLVLFGFFHTRDFLISIIDFACSWNEPLRRAPKLV